MHCHFIMFSFRLAIAYIYKIFSTFDCMFVCLHCILHWHSQWRTWRSQGKDLHSQSSPNKGFQMKFRQMKFAKWGFAEWTLPNKVCQMKFHQMKFRQIKFAKWGFAEWSLPNEVSPNEVLWKSAKISAKRKDQICCQLKFSFKN